MSNDSQNSSYDAIVANAVFIAFMLWLFFSKNKWGHFAFFLTVGNSWTSCAYNLSFLPQIKNHPSFLGVPKESVCFDSFFTRMLGGTIIYPTILLNFSEKGSINLFPYMVAGFICGIVFRKIVATIFYYLIVLPTIILLRIFNHIAAFLFHHKLIKRAFLTSISCILIFCVAFKLFQHLFPHRAVSASSSSSQIQYQEEPRQGEEVSKESETVWIPTHGGTKYHRRSTCSGMEDPEKTTKEDAIRRGFDPCQRCY